MASFHHKLLLLLLLLLPQLLHFSSAINTDGVLLLSFKFSILNDPLNSLANWNPDDQTPCFWNGVACSQNNVVSLSLPNSNLAGSIPADLGSIPNLQTVNLSNNSFNGSLPFSVFNNTHIRSLDFSNNHLSGRIPSAAGTAAEKISLRGNRFVGEIPGGFDSVRALDLSFNLLNGSLPSDFGGRSLVYLNVSNNRISGAIPAGFAAEIPRNAVVDLSFNNLTGEVPDSGVFKKLDRRKRSAGFIFAGNDGLCRKPCPVSSSPPAIAVLPTTITSSPADGSASGDEKRSGQSSRLRAGTIAGIVIGDVVGVSILFAVFFYVYHFVRKRKSQESAIIRNTKEFDDATSSSSSSSCSESRRFNRWSCLRKKSEIAADDEDSDEVDSQFSGAARGGGGGRKLVTVDGEKDLELETLLRATAYILGATGSSIVYKAVLEDGTSFAVRRIGENQLERFRDFENQVRIISKLVHPNLVRIRGFYWGPEEKLVIYDFVPNGSLANARYRKAGGSSPCHLAWESRLKIARGVARGLSFLHDKKHVHGNLKPKNILLGQDMEPKLGDFGLEKLVACGGDSSYNSGGVSARIFGSKRSTASRDSFPDLSSIGPSPSPSPSTIGGLSPYHAPESLRSIKPNPKWDVYSFGVVLLELLTGKVILVDETGQGSNGLAVEDKARALRMADVAIRADVEGQEEALLACFKLGYSCASPLPHKRPTMKEALQVLEKIPTPVSSSVFLYGQ
ncbi:Probable LRR receptor-like serine/threonine-protein kinase At4g37250 [Linum grandiflorum]